MVLYFKDLDNSVLEDIVIFIILTIIVFMPIIILNKNYTTAFLLSCILSFIQIFAIYNNVKKYPL